MTGVIDEPLRRNEEDNLGITKYADALFQFIKGAKTPMTIGVQGDWGSGKTSLMKLMEYKFEVSKLKTKQIWVNTWEHSLLKTPQEALVSIIDAIINELSQDLNEDKRIVIRKKAQNVLQGAFRVGMSMTGGVEGAKVAKEWMESDNSIAELKESLNKVVKELSPKKYNRLIVYIDDLDRLEPANAVEILELLKNIFRIENSVFVLAIDYNVVVKGLAKKFGALTKENRWEYDAFFHKIIQLTFQMPVNSYDIGNYLRILLKDIRFVKENELKAENLDKLIKGTIGNNPRSIKRLVNNIALNDIFVSLHDKTEMEKNEKFLLVALNCIQIQYPKIYEALTLDSDFRGWEANFADNFSDDSSDSEDRKKLKQELDNFKKYDSETWELELFKICYPEPRLRSRFTDVLDTLVLLKDVSNDKDLPYQIDRVVKQTKVTSTGLSGIDVQTEAYKQMPDLKTKLSQLRNKGLNTDAIKAFEALLKPSIDAANKNKKNIFVSLKEGACAIYQRDEYSRGYGKQWLYLMNPGKKPGLLFDVTKRSGLIDELEKMFINKIYGDKSNNLTDENDRSQFRKKLSDSLIEKNDRSQFRKNLSEKMKEEDYLKIIGDFGKKITEKIIGTEK